MTHQDTLPIVVEEPRYRVILVRRNKRCAVSGRLSLKKAKRRLSVLSKANTGDVYELERSDIPANTPWRRK